MVSQEEPCLKAVEFHRQSLERLWLICSNTSAPMAESIKRKAIGVVDRLKQDQHVRIVHVKDVDDLVEYHELVGDIDRKLPDGWSPDDVIADYVGMTKNASVGMALACMMHGWPLEYTQPRFDDKRQPIDPLPPREIAFKIRSRSRVQAGQER